MKTFVLDDDEETREVVASALARDGHQVTAVGGMDEARSLLQSRAFAVLVLDIMLGGDQSGLDLCAQLRQSGVETPILFLSARGAVRSRLEGFDAGGDDYLPKPFAIKELVARVRALGRRGPALRPHAWVLGQTELDLARRTAHVAGSSVALTAREWDVLELLVDARGRIVPFDTLLDRGWGEISEKSRASLAVIISRLRQKLVKGAGDPLIRTAQGVGYAIEGPR